MTRTTLERLFPGDSEMAWRMRQLDWEKTAVGSIESWPEALRTAVSTSLNCAFSIVIWWGRELALLYNDEYRSVLGPTKHPAALGQRGEQVWAEIWDVVGPMLSHVMECGEASRSRDLRLDIDRGYLEEAYFSFSYSPIFDDDGKVGGIFCPVLETTEKVIAERRLRTLRDLAATCDGAESEEEALRAAAGVLGDNGRDVPFAMFYRVDEARRVATLEASAGIEPGAAAWKAVPLVPGDAGLWSLGAVAESGETTLLTDLESQFAAAPTAARSVAAHGALVLPILLPGQERPRAILVAGVSAVRALDEAYRTFFSFVATQIASSLADALALEHERRRAEALAEVDRAKTAFFSNISHEFRTPLTLTAAGGRVLIADDSADMREYLTGLLNQLWTVEAACDGEQALELALQAPPDLILYDVMMPTRDGFGLLQALRSDPRTAHIPVIMLSARAGEESRVEGLVAGADDYLVKPFSAKEVMARVHVHLENARLRRALEVERNQLAKAHLEAESARKLAEAASLAKDEFLAMLGHEMRNPLAPMLTSLEVMRMRGIVSREQGILERQVDHLVRLVDDLLDVSRMTRGKVELKKARLEFAEVVRKGLEIASPLLEARKQRLDIWVPLSGLQVIGDGARLAQVVSNLITNAARYSGPGSTIHATADRGQGSVRLRVRDEGVGIAEDMLTRVFEPFVQEPQSLERAKGGLGLGLAIVRSLVELHGGTVKATSEGLGKGSEFVVELPLAPEVEEPVAEPATDCPTVIRASPGVSRVLVVDDSPDVAASLADLLDELGYEVAVAHDGPTALAIVKSFKPHVCLLDIGLPVMNGYELAQQLRASRDLPEGARIVAVTGYGQDADRRRSSEAGFNAHLVKPVNVELLTRTLLN